MRRFCGALLCSPLHLRVCYRARKFADRVMLMLSVHIFVGHADGAAAGARSCTAR